jgi:hypothetical protein
VNVKEGSILFFCVAALVALVVAVRPAGDAAAREARAFAEQTGIEGARAVCADYDTDGDGYVSCTLAYDAPGGGKAILPVECPGRWSFGSTCRAQRPATWRPGGLR